MIEEVNFHLFLFQSLVYFHICYMLYTNSGEYVSDICVGIRDGKHNMIEQRILKVIFQNHLHETVNLISAGD